MTVLRIACVGEAMMEMLVSTLPGPAEIGVAGDVLNTAVYLRRMLPPEHGVSFVSLLGTDRLSDDIVRFIEDQGVESAQIGRLKGKLPGTYAITTDEHGERSFLYWRRDSAARQLFHSGEGVSFDILDGFDVVYLSAITLAILSPDARRGFLNWLDDFRSAGGRFAFDSNYRPALWESPIVARETIEATWRRCDIALPSEDDELQLFGDRSHEEIVERFRSYGSGLGALKRGFHGPESIGVEIEPITFNTAKNVVDTTSAGDGFNGGYLAAILTGQSQPEALAKGHDLACRIIGHRGAIMPF